MHFREHPISYGLEPVRSGMLQRRTGRELAITAQEAYQMPGLGHRIDESSMASYSYHQFTSAGTR